VRAWARIARGVGAAAELPVAAAVAVTLSSCSLVVTDVDLATCNSDAQCEVLNRRGPSVVTPCFRWQCAAKEGSPGTCVLRELDADDDGFVSAACPGGTDCDDGRDAARPGGVEVCDGLDNDCDGVVDDGAFATAPDPMGVLGVSSVAQARFTGGEDATFVYRTSADEFVYTLEGGRPLGARPAIVPVTVSLGPDGGDYARLGVGAPREVENACARLRDDAASTVDACTSDADCGEVRTCEALGGGDAPACRNADGTFQRVPCAGAGDRACGSDSVCLGEGGVGACRIVAPAIRCSNEPGAEVRCTDALATCLQEPGFAGYCARTGAPAPVYTSMTCSTPNECNRVCAGGYCVAATRGGDSRGVGDVTVAAGTGCQQLADLAAAAFEGGWVLAGIERSGCSAGILRIGLVASDGRKAFFYGPEARSNVTFGVDPVRPWEPRLLGLPLAAANCTGRTRLRDGGAVGASAPSVAVDPRTPDALVAFRGGPAAAPGSCGGTPVPVEVIGVRREGTVGVASGQWVNATGDGVPQALGTTVGEGAPAVVSLGSERPWLVAHGDVMGRIALHLVRKPETFPPPPMARAPGHIPRPTQPLSITTLGTVAARGADFVVAAVGRTAGDVTEVGLAWLEGCTADTTGSGQPPSGTVRFARLRVDVAAGRVESDDPVTLDSMARPPSVAFGPTGVVSVGFRRDESSPPATDRQTGGWTVLWPSADGRELRGRRVAELDARPVEPATVIGGGLASATVAGAYTGGVVGAGGGYGVVDISRLQLFGGSLFCSPP
jgi:hypothetical protein